MRFPDTSLPVCVWLLLLHPAGLCWFLLLREAEVIHARWAMLGVISLLLSDLSGSPFPPKEVSCWCVVG